MRRDSYASGLRAALRVSVLSAAVGCNGARSPSVGDTVRTQEAGAGLGRTPSAAPSEAGTPGGAAARPTEAGAPRADAGFESDCRALFRGDDFMGAYNVCCEQPHADARAGECCRWAQTLYQTRGGGPNGNLCSPWGPPVPPPGTELAERRRGKSRSRGRPTLDLRAEAQAIAQERRLVLDRSSPFAPLAARTWRRRMVNEYSSSNVFEDLSRQMRDASCSARHVAAVGSFAAEERRHGALCAAVVETLGAAASAPVGPEEKFPLHREVPTAIEAVVRNVLSVCCLAETVAVALIGAERAEMPAGPLRTLLTSLWADEIGHARFGWRFLAETIPTLGPAAVARTNAYLARALAYLEAHERAHIPLVRVGAGAAAYGLCDGYESRALFYETVSLVILPQLARLGLVPEPIPGAPIARA